MKKTLFDYLWAFIDPVVAAIGLTKTQFFAIVLFTINLLVVLEVIPETIGQTIKDNIEAWISGQVALLAVTLQDTILVRSRRLTR